MGMSARETGASPPIYPPGASSHRMATAMDLPDLTVIARRARQDSKKIRRRRRKERQKAILNFPAKVGLLVMRKKTKT